MEISNPAELNTRPRSAYRCYIRFCKMIDLLPKSGLHSFPLSLATKELYKSYVERILDMNPDDMQQYVSDDRIAASKNPQQRWREADELTQSVFKEIAKKHQEEYKESVFNSYKSFAANHPMILESFSAKLLSFQHPSRATISSTDSTVYEEESSTCTKSNLPQHINNVDVAHTTPTSRQSQGTEGAYSHNPTSFADSFTMSLEPEPVKLPTQDPFQSTSIFYEEENSVHTQNMSSKTNKDMGVVPPTPTRLKQQVTEGFVPAPSFPRYQVTEVDMPDNDIMMMAISAWNIGPHVSSYLQNTDRTSDNGVCLCPLISDAATLRSALLSSPRRDVNETDMHSFLSGVDWS